MRSFWSVSALVAVVCGPVVVSGQTLQSGDPSKGYAANAWEMTVVEEAQSFQAANAFTATSASIWTSSTTYDGTPLVSPNGFRGQFNWALYTDVGGNPGTVFNSGSVVPIQIQQDFIGEGEDLEQWTFALPDLPIAANTHYWLGLLNTDSTGTFQDNPYSNGHYAHTLFAWAASYGAIPGIPGSQRRGPDGIWVQNEVVDQPSFGYGNRLALAVYGVPTTTPEPSSLALLGTGLVGLVPIVRRKKR